MSEQMRVDFSDQEVAFAALEKMPPYEGDIVFKLDGMDGEVYLKKLTDEMNAIDLDSIPFDGPDYGMAFFLAIIEIAGDFFLGDPQFKYSLANSNGPLVKWLKQFHDSIGHSGSPLDYQGPEFGGGAHRGKTFGHDSLPIARLLFGAKKDKDDSKEVKAASKAYNGLLLLRDVISCGFAIYQISTGRFIDCSFTKEGHYQWIVSTTNQNGTPYDACGPFVAVIKYLKHMVADFCSSTSLPIPGFSFLTHWPNRDVEAFALKLYKNGMNLRTMMLGGIPVGLVEILMRFYVHARYAETPWSESAVEHKLNKMLLLTHGITTAVNVGKVILTENPARLNLILIARTCQLVWKTVSEELSLTNRYMEKMEAGVLKARLESMKTLVLLNNAIYVTANYDRIIRESRKRVDAMLEEGRAKDTALKAEIDDIKSKLDDIESKL